MTWCQNLTHQMESGELAKDTLEAEGLLELHQERKAEIDGRYNYYLKQRDYGERLTAQAHPAREQIGARLQELDQSWAAINQTWEDRKQLLTQCYDLQVRACSILHSIYDLTRNCLQRVHAYVRRSDCMCILVGLRRIR